MIDDQAPLTNEGAGSPSVALLPATLAEQRNDEWSNAPALVQPTMPSIPDPMVYVHALRRHWLLSLGIGLLCAGIGGPAVWVAVGSKYTAESFLRVSMQEPGLLSASDRLVDRDHFEIYKSTQQQLVTSRFVLLAALRKTDVAKLSVVREQEGGDPAGWLQNRISVSFPGRAELMSVSITRRDAQEATTLVRAVVDAYLTEVVNAERDLKRQRISELDRAFAEKETEARKKRDDLKSLAEQVGGSATETLTAKQKSTVEELSIYRQEMARNRFDLRRSQGELAAQRAILKSIAELEVSDAELDEFVQRDPVARQLFSQLGMVSIDKAFTDGAVAPGAKSRYASRFQQDLSTLQEQFNARRTELVEVVRQKKRALVELDIRKLESATVVLAEQERSIQADVERLRKDADKFGSSTVDIEMLRGDIRNIDEVLTGIAKEKDKLKVEIRSSARVIPLQKAEVPEAASNTNMRIALTILTILGGLCCPAVVVALWDSRAKRINTCADVSKGLQLSVIGSVPLIPSRIIRHLGSPSKRNQMWHVRLTESVDGIAARVLRKAETEQCRVIMVSSATSGEGKTTLSTQLALSLARTGRRTVLVDFDLRRPSFDTIFGLPLEPGVCEVLRDQNPVSTLVHDIAANDLSVVTAGRWDRLALASLSNGAAAAMFKRLREDFDFVVIDTSPILPVADARFVSQHVDSVVLSVFRDISESPKIQAACEILTAFGVQNIEAVVTGPNDHMYGEHMGYESTISASNGQEP